MEKIERLAPDTSITIEGLLSRKLENNEIKVEEIIVHEAVLAELEHQANYGRDIGTLGLEEIKKIRELSLKLNFKLSFKGRRPNAVEIKHASLGEIDSLIRELAWEEGATLITGDKVQSKVAEAKGLNVIYVQPVIKSKKLAIEKYFDKETMSVHLRENIRPYAKRGSPGNWKFVHLDNKKLTQEQLQEMSKEIIEETRIRKDAFIEMERRGSTIVQLENYRIVITRPPLSDAHEITVVRPIKKMNFDEYQLTEKLKQRIGEQAEGILIAGSPGTGKSTFASALAEFYVSKEKTVKTIETPRDLQLSEDVTQYSISHATSQEIHDILLLTRPDYTVFDEMRNIDDFRLFADLRLSGVGMLGVVHATDPIDAIQRFIGKTELGVIPHVIDTVIFIKNGIPHKVLSVSMTVKVPSGMIEADLSRPVVEVRDFENNKLEYEIYSYGEETIVVPVVIQREAKPVFKFAARELENELKKQGFNVKAELSDENRATIYLPENEIARIIGKEGKNINELEKKLGISLTVKELNNLSEEEIPYKVKEDNKFIRFFFDNRYAGKKVDFYIDNERVFTANTGNKSEVRLHRKSPPAKYLINLLNSGKNLKIKV
ncbi:MAG: PINc/VapC family ATPase [Nanoarchaeota archaeon]